MKSVILIGDSIRLGYQSHVEKALSGQVEFWFPEQNGGTSENVLAHLEEWIIARQPSILHLNCGLHDLRVEFGAADSAVPLARYRANLDEMFRRLRESYKGKVIWALTTPVNEAWHHANKSFDRFESAVLAYNQAANEVCTCWDIQVSDLYQAVIDAGRDRLLRPDGVHFTDEGYAALGQIVAESIKKALAPAAPAHLKNQVTAVLVGAGHRGLT
jgi:lysophospholipase L1-like esterase